MDDTDFSRPTGAMSLGEYQKYHAGTSTGTSDATVGYYAVAAQPVAVNYTGEFMEVVSEPVSYKRKKRITILGRKVDSADEVEESLIALKWLKGARKKLSKKEQEKYEARAEKAFQEAIKNLESGMENVAKRFEKEMETALNKIGPADHGYRTYITNREIDRFTEHLPENKELVIEELDEYMEPLPDFVQESLEEAQEAGCFEKFVIFSVRRVPDPILFGVMADDGEKFYYIDEWDDDVSIEDFLKHKED